jgi:Cu+-exporting ATPase
MNTDSKKEGTGSPHKCCQTKSEQPKDKTASSSENKEATSTGKEMIEHELIIDGASCVSKIEKALLSVSGVQTAEMNFAQRTVTVKTNVDVSKLIHAVEQAGYNAKVSTSESEEEALDEKEQADWQYYKKLMRDMTLALVLGVPLMIYSLVVGEMTVNTYTERLVWLIVGLLTLGVMVFAGKHFYIGAWNSF